ncbi:MOSC domain-containing protein [Hyphobacterium sp. HN65]|uniref:MOSC domain-containing protein n=1 Tax=Hyphobacterium lacteum TaxID=3116575 RepID=A0ABU7LQA6_9PROT|nr:MOSC domain-containing protein [Hyphobacterium sp. HN65]MEE2526087.1 MOSC domain-containing protein [Hyphobacterium sp. HN65]
MTGRVVSLARHPMKGFTSEPLDTVQLSAGAHFPGDRLYAVEDGPSGFDPDSPEHIRKMAFTVLAKLPSVAAVRTKWDEDEGSLTAWHPDFGEITCDLDGEAGRNMFAVWLSGVLAGQVGGPLKVVAAPNGYRFMDSRSGYVSVINLDSVRDLEAKTGRQIDPARFRGNIMVEGWPAWSELDMAGRELLIGGARLGGLKPIERCVATHVDPHSAERDMDVVSMLREHYGHFNCGLYVEVLGSGRVQPGDEARLV